ncbi:MAG: hypothetical protein ACQES4_02730 [Bacillota bacterium]
MGYTLSHPVSTAIVGITNLAEVEENIRIASEFKPYTEEELRKLERLTEPYAEEANFFKIPLVTALSSLSRFILFDCAGLLL